MESIVIVSRVLSRLRKNTHQHNCEDSELGFGFQLVYVFLRFLCFQIYDNERLNTFKRGLAENCYDMNC